MSEKPIYVQLMDSIKKKIQDGQLQVGDRLGMPGMAYI